MKRNDFMSFEPFDDISTAWNAVLRYRLTEEGLSLPEEHAEKLTSFLELDAPTLTLSQTGEYVFARREVLKQAAPGLVALGARCAHYANRQCIDNLAGARGRGITDALRRDSGEAADPRLPWPDPSEDPEPRAEFAPASAAPVLPAPAAQAVSTPAAQPAPAA
jgi:hypothetical protein